MASSTVILAASAWLRGLWSYYRRYTNTAIHTAATAALAIFGLLVFVDPWFAAVAIACYVVPPVVLYVRTGGPVSREDGDQPLESQRSARPDPTVESATSGSSTDDSSARRDSISELNRTAGTDDVDRSSDDGDTDFDSDGTDTDSDSDGTDTDSDSDGTETDSDSNGTDTDSDRDG
ncbi:hypothetical protein GS429_18245 [Natronorubrum sp. JWXQ-INN-674]|uniref:Uncharacterized protein n=1 Tax=Natronorubrum halalkaliphilum TaxID=2691917 RepID=A0A6B0VSE4_9EURY|nr:hypothetical protein [Natronorubrum halalkaliphilum]MXV63967.1 hypothetical protein [Natronorubrum halalkaliphilum]